MKNTKWFLLVCALIFLSVTSGWGQSVTSVGLAQTRQMAIDEALRSAVEQGVGTLIDSKTKVANFEVLQDQIYSRSSGYVTDYKILSENKSSGSYTVTIRANVRMASIKNDLSAIGILMAQVGNHRFMAIYVPETRVSAQRNSMVVKAAEGAINGVFARKGFIVLDKMLINDVYNEIEQAGRIDVETEDLAALSLKYKADLLLIYDVRAAQKKGGQSRFFGGIMVDISLRAVAPATADLIAQKAGDLTIKTSKSMAGDYYANHQAAKSADRLGKAVAQALIGDTLAYFERSVHAGTRFDVWFRNFSEQETYTIVKVIEAMSGYKDKNVRNESPGNFQLDVNYQGKKFDFKRALYQGLKQKGIRFKTQQSKGNRFLLFKDRTDEPFSKVNPDLQKTLKKKRSASGKNLTFIAQTGVPDSARNRKLLTMIRKAFLASGHRFKYVDEFSELHGFAMRITDINFMGFNIKNFRFNKTTKKLEGGVDVTFELLYLDPNKADEDLITSDVVTTSTHVTGTNPEIMQKELETLLTREAAQRFANQVNVSIVTYLDGGN